ncbi:MAG: hypothetical protein ACT4P4_06920 [Betaproteobacteria bacterium]
MRQRQCDKTRDETSEETRVETITAALIFLMSHYARTGCPRLAVCIARHMQCLALHPDSAPVLRDVCASLHGCWSSAAATQPAPSRAELH